jgi:hypothetical protein
VGVGQVGMFAAVGMFSVRLERALQGVVFLPVASLLLLLLYITSSDTVFAGALCSTFSSCGRGQVANVGLRDAAGLVMLSVGQGTPDLPTVVQQTTWQALAARANVSSQALSLPAAYCDAGSGQPWAVVVQDGAHCVVHTYQPGSHLGPVYLGACWTILVSARCSLHRGFWAQWAVMPVLARGKGCAPQYMSFSWLGSALLCFLFVLVAAS